MAVERVYLIRHGRTAWNVDRRWQGWIDKPLDTVGAAQAQALGAFLRDRPIKALISSDLQRAWQTAQAVGDALAIPPQADERLREFNVGIFGGLNRDELAAKYPDIWQAYLNRGLEFVVPEGESRLSLQTRAYEAWQTALEEQNGPEIALFSHGGTIRFLLMKIFEQNPDIVTDLRLPNTSITTLARNGAGWRAVGLGETPHLEPEAD